MKEKRPFEIFLGRIADFAKKNIEPVHKARQSGEHPEMTVSDVFEAIFNGFSEISSTLDALLLSEKLIAAPAPRSVHVPKEQYLRFVINAYLHEMYILEQRITSYAKKISRIYKIPLLETFAKEYVYAPLEDIIKVRCAHVHQIRYTDIGLSDMDMFSLLHRAGDELGIHLPNALKSTKISWTNTIKSNNKATLEIVDSFFEQLLVVMCQNDKIAIPPNHDNRPIKTGRAKPSKPRM